MNDKRNTSKIKIVFLFSVFLSSLFHISKMHAAESGVSFYVPGLYGDAAIAVPLPPGFYLLSTTLYYDSKAPHPLLPNEIDNKLEADISSQLLRGFWVPDQTLFGAKIMAGFRINALNVDVEAELSTPFGTVDVQDDNLDFGDIAVMPLSLYWKMGDIYFNLYEVISIPTGKYDPNRFANTSLNRWAFDSVLAMTWIDQTTGLELSAAPGLIYNTKNRDTDYKTGVEFHMDAMINLHLSKALSLGVHGSMYKQLTEDKGGDPSLGSFKGRSYSLGPAITWRVQKDDSLFYTSLKWLHEFDTVNKTEGDYMIFSVGAKF